MYINKKSMPESIKGKIKIKDLEKLLEIEKTEYDTFEYMLIYNNEYIIHVDRTFEWHKTKGAEYKITSVKYIYLIDEEGRRYSYAV